MTGITVLSQRTTRPDCVYRTQPLHGRCARPESQLATNTPPLPARDMAPVKEISKCEM